MSQAFLLVVQLCMLFLRTVAKSPDCPDGLCKAPLELGEKLSVQLKAPVVGIGIFDMFRFLRSFPMERVLAVGKRVLALINGCGTCPDGECSFMDILKCLDLDEAVSIVMEILSILRDSNLVNDDRGNEITLGEAVAE